MESQSQSQCHQDISYQADPHIITHIENLVYIVECSKCRLQYIGETKNTAEKRWAEHLGYVRNKRLDQATGAHFNLPGHNIDHMKFSVLEKITSNNPQYRKARESYFIEKFNLKYAGMNVKR